MQWTEKVPGCNPKGENTICLSSVFMKHHYCVGSKEAPRWETTRDKDSIVCGFCDAAGQDRYVANGMRGCNDHTMRAGCGQSCLTVMSSWR